MKEKETKKEVKTEIENIVVEEETEEKIDKKDSTFFNIAGIVAIILIIGIGIYIYLNTREKEEITPMNEKWVFKSDNNLNGLIDIGDEICIYTECFYVTSTDGIELKALAKYNLDVGYNCIYKDDDYICEKIKNETNIQSEKAIGYSEKTYKTTGNYGVTDFSKRVYWKNYDEYTENDFIIELDVSSNLLRDYLKTYKNKLELFGAKLKDVTLITRDELRSLGCPLVLGACDTNYKWIYSTSYWTRSSRSLGNVWKIQTSNYFSSNDFDYRNFNGVRPLIVIDVNELK